MSHIDSIESMPWMKGRKIVTLFSGGVDSTTLLYALLGNGAVPFPLTIGYGQRHHKAEAEAAQLTLDHLGLEGTHISLDLGPAFQGSALTDENVAVPHMPYSNETIAVTVVPNRNAIMASIAFAMCVSRDADGIALAVHAGDHAVYPDCRPQFWYTFSQLMSEYLIDEKSKKVDVVTPFVNMSKTEIVTYGDALGVSYEFTWSCYEGHGVHCGTCSTCIERQRAFAGADLDDPTVYEKRVEQFPLLGV